MGNCKDEVVAAGELYMGKELEPCGRGREYGSMSVWEYGSMGPIYNPRGSQTCQVTENIEDSLLRRNVIRGGESSRAWLQCYLLIIYLRIEVLVLDCFDDK